MIEPSKSFGRIYREGGVFSQPYSSKINPKRNSELFEKKGLFYFPKKSFSQDLAKKLITSNSKIYSDDFEPSVGLIDNILFYTLEEANQGNFDLDVYLQLWKGDFGNILTIKNSIPKYSFGQFLKGIKDGPKILKERDFRHYFNKNTIVSSEKGGLLNIMYRFPKKK
jgi:hypothetical protein